VQRSGASALEAGDAPVPLRGLGASDASVLARSLEIGTLGIVGRILGRTTIVVSAAIPLAERNRIAEHCWATHRRVCRTLTCATARSILPIAPVVCEAIEAASA
jgi:hypothetical protein